MKKFSTMTLVLVVAVMLAAPAIAGPTQVITITKSAGIGPGGADVYDFQYTPSDGSEFLTYTVVASFSAAVIAHPNQSAQSDDVTDGVAMDTFFNTAGSAFGVGAASYIFDVYNPGGFSPDSQPTAALNWTVFDTLAGDNMSWHLGRLILDPSALGTVSIGAQDQGHVGEEAANNFVFDIPEPATMLVLLGGAVLSLIRRR